MTVSFDAILFDCDGLLVDSEVITNRVLCTMLNERGWAISQEECTREFIGKMVKSQAALIEEKTGKPFNQEWLDEFYVRRNEALRADLVVIDGALDAVKYLHAQLNGQIAVASGADRFKVEMQLQKVGLAPYFEGRVFSGHELPRTKPAPDVYLAASAALGIAPERCAVVEDSVTGVRSGLDAGATVFGYAPGGPGHSSAEDLLAAGVVQVFSDMAELPALLAA